MNEPLFRYLHKNQRYIKVPMIVSGYQRCMLLNKSIGMPVCCNGAFYYNSCVVFTLIFDFSIWVGVELKEPSGKNDGSVSGRRYFHCEMNYGIFAPSSKVNK